MLEKNSVIGPLGDVPFSLPVLQWETGLVTLLVHSLFYWWAEEEDSDVSCLGVVSLFPFWAWKKER